MLSWAAAVRMDTLSSTTAFFAAFSANSLQVARGVSFVVVNRLCDYITVGKRKQAISYRMKHMYLANKAQSILFAFYLG